MRGLIAGIACVLSLSAGAESMGTCGGRSSQAGGVAITWHTGPVDDGDALDAWCRGVGAPLLTSPAPPAAATPPALNELVVLTWNAHVDGGRLPDLIADLRAGRLTAGQPVQHFVLLLQELYRVGPEVPAFSLDARSAFAIQGSDPRAPDASDYSKSSGLAMFYVPSMRNGAARLEDRGNAIVSTEPLLEPLALELPLERQRRVAVGASVQVRTSRGTEQLHFLNAHLEPLSSRSSLWLFRNPRRRQIAALLALLRSSRFDSTGTVGTVLGGDFNTIQRGVEEDAYLHARAWSRGLGAEDPRATHFMGRIDYVFARIATDWMAITTRVDKKYGSDHHPVLARFQRVAGTRNMW